MSAAETLFLTPVMPAEGGNGLAMRAGLLLGHRHERSQRDDRGVCREVGPGSRLGLCAASSPATCAPHRGQHGEREEAPRLQAGPHEGLTRDDRGEFPGARETKRHPLREVGVTGGSQPQGDGEADDPEARASSIIVPARARATRGPSAPRWCSRSMTWGSPAAARVPTICTTTRPVATRPNSTAPSTRVAKGSTRSTPRPCSAVPTR